MLRKFAGAILGAMLFAQAAMAIAACMWPGRAPATAIAQNAAAPCHEQAAPADSLCIAHCMAEFQSPDRPVAWNIALPMEPVLEIRAAAGGRVRPAARHLRIAPQAAAPPHILFLHLLI